MRLAIYGDTKKFLSTRIAVHIGIDGEKIVIKPLKRQRKNLKIPFTGMIIKQKWTLMLHQYMKSALRRIQNWSCEVNL